MRFQYSIETLSEIFEAIKKASGEPWGKIAHTSRVSERTLSDWRRGATRISKDFLDLMQETYSIHIPTPAKIFDESVERIKAAKKGAGARYALYGNLGTSTGRKKGGTASSANNVHFKKKPAILPAYSLDLAEFVGIVLGDGGISSRQITITLHKTDDHEYSLHVKKLIERLFGIPVGLHERPDAHVVQVVISRTSVVEYISEMGLKRGSKVRNQTDVPLWIKEDHNFSKACARGLMDTDGCLYIDRHIINNKPYQHICLNFTNRSLPLLTFFKETLQALGLHPTESTPWSVLLRREKEVIRYMNAIGTSNLKIKLKFDRFMSTHSRRGVRVVE